MSNGYIIFNSRTNQVLCLAPDKKSLAMVDVTSPSILNKAVCAPDLTAAKNVFLRIQRSEDHKDVIAGAEIQHIARLYKKFF